MAAWSMIFSFLFGTTVTAQDKTTEIDKIFSWATPVTPGCACAVSKDGKVVVNRAYGSADLEREVPLNPNSVFDAGSLVKQFVAAATLVLVEDGKLSLTDDVRKYVPELPDYGHKITIDHLLTHTSGIRDWTGILPLASKSTDALTLTLRQRSLNFAPGEDWSYSSSGFVLLKEIVARVSGMSFDEFTQKRLFEPLGMKLTGYRSDLREVIKNRAVAYDRAGAQWKMAMQLDNDRGGGGALLTTASDLLIWNDALTNNRLSKFVSEKIQEPARLSNGRKISYGRGLFIDSTRGTPFWWHGGSADGYKSVLVRFPSQGLSIAIMCNSGDGTDRIAFARRIFELLAPPPAGQAPRNNMPPAVADGVDASQLDLKSREGLFFNETNGEAVRLVEAGGRLRIANGPMLTALSKDRFKCAIPELDFMAEDQFEIQFLSNERFELKSMEGKVTRYRRAKAYAPKADELKAFAGRFESDEIGTVFEVMPKGEGLLLRLEHTQAKGFEFKPIDTDAFQFSRITVRFRRDKSGKVVGMDFSNPVVRNVKFVRVNDAVARVSK